MARIRTIKPEFWTSEQVVNCSPIARLLFIGIWNFADDHGIHPANPRRLKMEVFPGDDGIDSTSVRRMVDELSSNGLIVEYESGGETYWIVTGWDHQRIDKPTFKYPLPDKSTMLNLKKQTTYGETSTSTIGAVDEHSTSPRLRNGMECNGKEENSSCAPSSEGFSPLQEGTNNKPPVQRKKAKTVDHDGQNGIRLDQDKSFVGDVPVQSNGSTIGRAQNLSEGQNTSGPANAVLGVGSVSGAGASQQANNSADSKTKSSQDSQNDEQVDLKRIPGTRSPAMAQFDPRVQPLWDRLQEVNQKAERKVYPNPPMTVPPLLVDALDGDGFTEDQIVEAYRWCVNSPNNLAHGWREMASGSMQTFCRNLAKYVEGSESPKAWKAPQENVREKPKRESATEKARKAIEAKDRERQEALDRGESC